METRHHRGSQPLNVLVVFQAWRAHFLPMLVYLMALQRRGHRVIVAAPEHLREYVEQNGFEFVPIGEDWTMHPRLSERILATLTEKNNHQFNRQLFRGFTVSAESLARGIVNIARDGFVPDVVFSDISAHGAKMGAELIGAHFIAVENGLLRLIWELYPEYKPFLDRPRARLGLPAEPDDGPAILSGTVVATVHPGLLYDGVPLRIVGLKDEPQQRVEPIPGFVTRATRPILFVMHGASSADAPTWGPMMYRTVTRTLEAARRVGGFEVVAAVGATNVQDYAAFQSATMHIVGRVNQPGILDNWAHMFVNHGGQGSVKEFVHAAKPTVVVGNSTDQPPNGEFLAERGLVVALDTDTATVDEVAEALQHTWDHHTEYTRRLEAVRDSSDRLPTPDVFVAALEADVALGDPSLPTVNALAAVAREHPLPPPAPLLWNPERVPSRHTSVAVSARDAMTAEELAHRLRERFSDEENYPAGAVIEAWYEIVLLFRGFGVRRSTVEHALGLLEADGVIEPHGIGQRPTIATRPWRPRRLGG